MAVGDPPSMTMAAQMRDSSTARIDWRAPPRTWRIVILVAGIVAGQACLYGSALVGRQLLLPLDLLALPTIYLPSVPASAGIVPRDRTHLDPVWQYEFVRRFSASEIRAGRWPLWSPYGYAGAPFSGVQATPFQSLYAVVWPSPNVLGWIQLAVAIVAGTGVYRFVRDACGTRFWPAAVAAWCLPLSGFYVIWQGHPLPHAAAFLPWLMWATDAAIRRQRPWGGPLVAVFTYGLLGGALDIAAQALLVSGMYALWQAAVLLRRGRLRMTAIGLGGLTAGWVLGIVLTFVGMLPFLEYAPTSARLRDRVAGARERPAIGLSEVVNVIAPELQGSLRHGDLFLGESGNVPESAAAGAIHTRPFGPPSAAACSRRASAGTALAGCGAANRKPCASGQSSAPSRASCAGVSTPSAAAVTPSARHKPVSAPTIASASAVSPSPSIQERSIFTLSTGSRRRKPSEVEPAPKSSSAMPTPSARTWCSIAIRHA